MTTIKINDDDIFFLLIFHSEEKGKGIKAALNPIRQA